MQCSRRGRNQYILRVHSDWQWLDRVSALNMLGRARRSVGRCRLCMTRRICTLRTETTSIRFIPHGQKSAPYTSRSSMTTHSTTFPNSLATWGHNLLLAKPTAHKTLQRSWDWRVMPSPETQRNRHYWESETPKTLQTQPSV